MRVCVRMGGGVYAQGLLIGLIRQRCCTAPERIILLLPSFLLFFLFCFDVLKAMRSLPPASPPRSCSFHLHSPSRALSLSLCIYICLFVLG